MSLSIGQGVTDFSQIVTSPNGGQAMFNLAEHQGKNIVLYFYPKDSTPGCTTESMEFRDLYDAFLSHNTQIYGISRDSIKSHHNFKAKLGLPFELISDGDEKVCQLFDVIKQKKLYGKDVRGIERSTFLIDKKGILVQDWRGIKATSHAQTVLSYIKENLPQ